MAFVSMLLLLLAGVVLCQGDAVGDEAVKTLGEVGNLLGDSQEIKDALAEIKKEVSKGPEVSARLLGMGKALKLAVPKLKSSNTADVAQGVLDVVAGVAEFVPGGAFIAPLATLVSSAIGLLSSTKVDNTIRDVVRDVVRETSDRELEGEASASRAELTAAMNYLLSKHSQQLDSDDVTRMTSQIKVTTGAGILEMLATRIRYRSKASSAKESKQCLQFSLLYAQIASFRDMVFNDLIIQIRRAGDNDEANGYENVKTDFINSYYRTLKFLNHPEPSQAGVVHLFHPTNQSKAAKYIHKFMKMAKIEETEPWQPSSYILLPVKWPEWVTFLHPDGYIRLRSGYPSSDDLITFQKRSDDYWELKMKGKWLTIDTTYPDYIGSTTESPESNQRSHFFVMKYPNKNIITISCRKWPDKFWKGLDNGYYVRLREGNFDTDAQFKIVTHRSQG